MFSVQLKTAVFMVLYCFIVHQYLEKGSLFVPTFCPYYWKPHCFNTVIYWRVGFISAQDFPMLLKTVLFKGLLLYISMYFVPTEKENAIMNYTLHDWIWHIFKGHSISNGDLSIYLSIVAGHSVNLKKSKIFFLININSALFGIDL